MCQSLRLTVVARLVESETPWQTFDRFLGAGLSLVAIAIVVQLLFGGPIADVLTGNLGTAAQDLARNTLDILCIAIVGQLVAALGAAVLAMRNEFRYPGLAYVAGGYDRGRAAARPPRPGRDPRGPDRRRCRVDAERGPDARGVSGVTATGPGCASVARGRAADAARADAARRVDRAAARRS